ncbi:hypothetical protein [Brevundimonas sp.]|uniref:hypothetical protein n=1 Tax=Brevundimonas sp. TaxID=1871086 RepID=UPI0028A0A4B4|nr:hypothetical protein [Brevundimonas sp.]
MAEKFSTRLMGAWVRTRQVSGDAADATSKFVTNHKNIIVDGTSNVLGGVGLVSENAGQDLAQRCQNLRNDLREKNAEKESEGLGTFLDRASDASLGLGALIGRSLGSAGRRTRNVSPFIGAATGGVVAGTVRAVTGAVSAVAIQKSDVDALEKRLAHAGEQARLISQAELERIEDACRHGRRNELLDLLVIGGVSLSSIALISASVPMDVERAFELAYPGLAASGEGFADVVARVPSENLVGLISGVKGKLFELELVDQFNQGGLAEGLHAEMAVSSTQPGYDIRIFDSEGQTVDLLQAKATDSVSYVKEALERYPNIDVATTSEVHGQLLAMGLGKNVSDGGITDAFLQSKVETAAGLGVGLSAADFVPSALGLAVIAFSAFSARDTDMGVRSEQFGERAGKAGISGGVGAVLMLATGAWLLAPIGGIGFSMLTTSGDAKRQRYDALKRIVESMEMDNARRTRRASSFVQRYST